MTTENTPWQGHDRYMKQRWFDLGILTLFCVVLFGVFLGTRPLNVPDEGRYPNVAREMLVTGDYITPRVNGVPFLDKPALYYWLEAGSMKAFGVNKWAIRLPQAIFGWLGVLALYLFGRKFYNRRTGLLAGFLLAVSPLYYFSARYANMDLEVGLWISWALMGFFNFYQALENQETHKRYRGQNWIWFAGACAGFGVLTKGLIGVVLPGLVIVVFLLTMQRARYLLKLHWFTNLLIIMAICSPWYLAVQHQNPWFFHYFFVYQQFERFTSTGFNNAMPFYFYLGVLLAGLLPWSFLILWRLPRLKKGWLKRRQRPITWFLMLWVGLITLFFSIPQSKIVGYILPVVPALALLCARVLDKLSARFQKVIMGAIAFMAVFDIAATLAVPHFDHKPAWPLYQLAKPYVTQNTVLASYDTYYQDLPIYFNRRFKVVYDWDNSAILQSDNWARDFYYGYLQDPKAKAWLITDKAFLKLWQQSADIVVFTDKDDSVRLLKELSPKPTVLESGGDFIIIKGHDKFEK